MGEIVKNLSFVTFSLYEEFCRCRIMKIMQVAGAAVSRDDLFLQPVVPPLVPVPLEQQAV